MLVKTWQDNQELILSHYFAVPDDITNYKRELEPFKHLLTKQFEAVADVGCGPIPAFVKYPIKAGFYSPIDPLFHEFVTSGDWPQFRFDKTFPLTVFVPEQFFDCVLCLNTLNYVDNIEEFIKSLYRITEDKCLLILTFTVGDRNSYHPELEPGQLIPTLSRLFDIEIMTMKDDKFYFAGYKRPEESNDEDFMYQ